MRTRKAHEENLQKMRERFADVRNAQSERGRDRARGLKTYRNFVKMIGHIESRIQDLEAERDDLEYQMQIDLTPPEIEACGQELLKVVVILEELYGLQLIAECE